MANRWIFCVGIYRIGSCRTICGFCGGRDGVLAIASTLDATLVKRGRSLNDGPAPSDVRCTLLRLFVEMLLWGIGYGALVFGSYLISLLWQQDWRFVDYAAWIAMVLFIIMVVVVWQRSRQRL